MDFSLTNKQLQHKSASDNNLVRDYGSKLEANTYSLSSSLTSRGEAQSSRLAQSLSVKELMEMRRNEESKIGSP